MLEAPVTLATELLQYLEHEEARLVALGGELARLRTALVSGSAERIEEALRGLIEQTALARHFCEQRAMLQSRLPRRSDGKNDWAAIEAALNKDSAQALSRQRERLWRLAQQVQEQVRQVAVLAWFGQELYGRILRAILGESGFSGQYGRQGQSADPSAGHLLQILG